MAKRRRRHGQGAFLGDCVGPNPTDRAKNGTKRSAIEEADGGPLGVVVAGANVHDTKLLKETIESIVVERPEPSDKSPQHLCLDKGYDNPTGHRAAAEGNYVPHIRRIGEEKLDEKKCKRRKARRWVVERTHARMAERVPGDSDSLREKVIELPGHHPTRLRSDVVSSSAPIGRFEIVT